MPTDTELQEVTDAMAKEMGVDFLNVNFARSMYPIIERHVLARMGRHMPLEEQVRKLQMDNIMLRKKLKELGKKRIEQERQLKQKIIKRAIKETYRAR